ncbi:unnamed protein product [Paramecium octaurelia]|uniref:Uncharacterized protein n=1 Tax=Paramecium octaurelia TaxID=43137 RepID=A0A8S1VGS3_PAROT|nr:unnamed protein product [Paramecium octaurelia]
MGIEFQTNQIFTLDKFEQRFYKINTLRTFIIIYSTTQYNQLTISYLSIIDTNYSLCFRQQKIKSKLNNFLYPVRIKFTEEELHKDSSLHKEILDTKSFSKWVEDQAIMSNSKCRLIITTEVCYCQNNHTQLQQESGKKNTYIQIQETQFNSSFRQYQQQKRYYCCLFGGWKTLKFIMNN